MCGIAGEHRTDGGRPAIADRPGVVLPSLSRRGPDASGAWGDDACCFVHARLSILDLDARSNQPMISSDGRYVLAYNGEIFNFRAVRSQLEHRGVTFRTEGDSEVLLAQFIH